MLALRFDLITGVDGATPSVVHSSIETLLRARGLAATVTLGKGTCHPWPTERVAIVTLLFGDVDATDYESVRDLARDLRRVFKQEAVVIARSPLDYMTFVED